ncbi:uncharacterized protein BCR38DRAFT_449277 [Pseudomassariella vexata]|uniref:DUF676 domain-containing protein n=1 Tax=Pseudomassariella vexata TaxID=1141098 RepID=A0A1Y2DEF0_9PEZI|nr:uncharacterized protein BCR38DRAFT_449277 [Pseudomassariella vexata]ORY57506.1 hypothetical protein BCR38DRAFT_449277 [Pseudomassariella vexata]
MKRIRLALARMTRARKPASLEPGPAKTIESSFVTSSTTLTPSTRRNSWDDDVGGPLVLYDGTARGDEDHSFDIVFVHGVGGHRIRTWEKDGVCWPRDLLSRELEEARIITWGYYLPDANGDKSTYGSMAALISDGLIADLAMVCDQPRDIIFVGHGLGGLVIKEALSTAATSQVFGKHTELGNIYNRTIGAIFLGTPHIGNRKQSLGDVVAAAAQVEYQRANPRLFQLLRDNNDLFENQREEWAMCSRDMQVVCVREQLPTPTGGMVPKSTSHYEGLNVTTDDIVADHMDIARFSSRRDAGYFQLVGHISKISRNTKLEQSEARLVRNREILDTLQFDTREKEEQHDDAYRQSCSWLLSTGEDAQSPSAFHEWLEAPGSSLFWMSGRAGSGKTTLMRYAFHDPQTRRHLETWANGADLIMAAVCLTESGSHVQRSREGILRGILFQILSIRQDLIPICFPSFIKGPWPPPVPFNTTLNLSQAFFQLFSRMSKTLRLCIFIDGLNEYRVAENGGHDDTSEADTPGQSTDGEGGNTLGSRKWLKDSHREIAKLITDLGSQDHVKLCVSSRELPPFETEFRGLPRLRVHTQTEKFIAKYCAERLEQVIPGLSASQTALCNELARKSRGDVIWALNVINMLLEGSLKKLNSTLDSLPTHLGGTNGLYMRIIENLHRDQQRQACRIFQIVLQAQDPPSPIMLAFAEEGYLAPARVIAKNPQLGELLVSHDNVRPYSIKELGRIRDQMENRLAGSCAGLLEIEAGPTSTSGRVVFKHMTAKEFIIRREIWDKVNIEPPNKVEINFSLLSGTIRHLKCFTALKSPLVLRPKIVFHPEFWLGVASALKYAARVDEETFDHTAYYNLLDELDQISNEIWNTALRQHVPPVDDFEWNQKTYPALARQHWASFEPMDLGPSPKRNDFLCLAVQANLVNYVAAKLGQLEDDARRAKAEELLEYAASPEGDSGTVSGPSVPACVSLTGSYKDFHHDMPDSRFLDLLFDSGASTAAPKGQGAWLKVLKAGNRYFSRQNTAESNMKDRNLVQNRQRWVAAVIALLAHGADPNVQIELSQNANGEGSTEIRSAIEVIRDILEGEIEYTRDLVRIEALAMGVKAEHVGA